MDSAAVEKPAYWRIVHGRCVYMVAYGPRVYDPHRRTVQQLKDQQKRLQAKIQTQQKKYGGKDLVQLAEEAFPTTPWLLTPPQCLVGGNHLV